MNNLFTYCGLYCGTCASFNNGCKGCVQEKPAYDCDVRPCAINKGIAHCGECSSFPCNKVETLAGNLQTDIGADIISTLRQWQAIGSEAWLKQNMQ